MVLLNKLLKKKLKN